MAASAHDGFNLAGWWNCKYQFMILNTFRGRTQAITVSGKELILPQELLYYTCTCIRTRRLGACRRFLLCKRIFYFYFLLCKYPHCTPYSLMEYNRSPNWRSGSITISKLLFLINPNRSQPEAPCQYTVRQMPNHSHPSRGVCPGLLSVERSTWL